VHITWDEARSYCENHGGRLPTRDEWSRAAYTEGRAAPPAGLETGRRYRYPVGDRPAGMNVNGGDDPWPRHAMVNDGQPGINGLYHMGGNVWEWVSNRDGDAALTAGGSWWYGSEQTTENAMQWKPAAFYAVYVGFRCAYDG
jgi:formylglycine-generating enzyme required for sulfatase activity